VSAAAEPGRPGRDAWHTGTGNVFVANEQHEVEVDPERLAGLALLAMEAEGVAEGELSILVVDTDVMADLNERYYAGERRPTDVLAFPIDGPPPPTPPPLGPSGPGTYGASRAIDELDDDEDEEGDGEPWLLGDVVLCPAYAAEGAAKAGHSLEAELELLVVHGILHLCGLDHAEPEEERAMTARTDELLARWRSGGDTGV
jgi:probable rRNA maturation factor